MPRQHRSLPPVPARDALPRSSRGPSCLGSTGVSRPARARRAAEAHHARETPHASAAQEPPARARARRAAEALHARVAFMPRQHRSLPHVPARGALPRRTTRGNPSCLGSTGASRTGPRGARCRGAPRASKCNATPRRSRRQLSTAHNQRRAMNERKQVFSIGTMVVSAAFWFVVSAAVHLVFSHYWYSDKTWSEIAISAAFFGIGVGFGMPWLRRLERRRKAKSAPEEPGTGMR